jgi:hypothetical protein
VWHAEISRVFTVQAEANAELRDQAAVAARIDVLAVRALGLIALNDSMLRGPLAARVSAVDVRVLLLDPDSLAAAIRAAEIGESPDSFGAGIRLALARLAEFADHVRRAGNPHRSGRPGRRPRRCPGGPRRAGHRRGRPDDRAVHRRRAARPSLTSPEAVSRRLPSRRHDLWRAGGSAVGHESSTERSSRFSEDYFHVGSGFAVRSLMRLWQVQKTVRLGELAPDRQVWP